MGSQPLRATARASPVAAAPMEAPSQTSETTTTRRASPPGFALPTPVGTQAALRPRRVCQKAAPAATLIRMFERITSTRQRVRLIRGSRTCQSQSGASSGRTCQGRIWSGYQNIITSGGNGAAKVFTAVVRYPTTPS